MGIQSFVPSSGGGMPGASFIAAIQMTTYNRSWTQAGGPGDYVLVSNKLSNGYAYFISGGTTTGVPIGNVINLSSGFSRIDIVAPKDDYLMLYKVATKTTSEFANPLAAFASFPSIVTSSGNFVLPNNALPLVNVLACGAGGGAHHHSGGGGGGGVVKLTAYQAVGTTSITIGSGGYHSNGAQGGSTYFGNVYALGGGSSADTNSTTFAATAANGGGYGYNGSHSGNTYGGSGSTQTASTGLGTSGSPTYNGGYRGGGLSGSFSPNHGGGGGAGAGGDGGQRTSGNSGTGLGGPGHISNITGSNVYYGSGGGGSHHASPAVNGSVSTSKDYGGGGNSGYNNHEYGQNGVVVVRYYIP